MTDPDRRAEEEVEKQTGFTQHDGHVFVGTINVGTMRSAEGKLYALAVRLMRYKLGVEEAKEEMEEVMAGFVDDDDWYFGRRTGITETVECISRLTQEQGKE